MSWQPSGVIVNSLSVPQPATASPLGLIEPPVPAEAAMV